MSQDNINIQVTENNDIVNIVSSEIVEQIDINVSENVEQVTFNVTEEVIEVNINKITNISAVNSVNGQTGDVVINVPTKTSDLTNDSGFITASEVPTVNDATSSVKGILKLTNDLGGTADLPTVPALINKVNKSTTITINGITYDLSANRTYSIANGGTTGQILAKNSATNYDWSWIDNFTEDVRDTVKATQIINKGQAVYISGANGTNQLASLADYNNESTSSQTIGIAAQNFTTNAIGQVITQGILSGINTSAGNAGDPVYLGANGNLIYGFANKPYAPKHLVYIGVITRSNAINGEIYINISNGWELEELHNVDLKSTTPVNEDFLRYESSTSLWKNVQITASWILSKLGITTLSGSNTGDETQATIKSKLGASTTSTDGYLSSTDWNTFNGKQNALGYTPENVANKQTDLTASSTKYPTVDAVNTGLATKEPTIASGTTSQYWRGDKSWQTLDKSAVGLGNVDNTSDANKPISTATQTALNGKLTKNSWVDYSATSTIVGWSSFTTKLIYYYIVGDIATVMVHLDGTSNSATTSITLPFTQTSIAMISINTRFTNNGIASATAGRVTCALGSNVAVFTIDGLGTAFTSANQKLILATFQVKIA